MCIFGASGKCRVETGEAQIFDPKYSDSTDADVTPACLCASDYSLCL